MSSRLDADADGVARPEDCDDGDASVGGEQAGFVDADGDGFGGPVQETRCAGTGLSADGSDCDDANAEVFPGSPEVCNDEDDDCDTVADDGVEAATWYFDGDGDTYGTPFATQVSCTQPPGYVGSGSDCDDADAALNPETLWYPDADDDGFGDASLGIPSCEAPAAHLRDGSDCDDTRAEVFPGSLEVCDTLNADEDCDGLQDDADPSATGQVLWYADTDGDGVGTVFQTTLACDAPVGYVGDPSDCEDSDAAVTAECAWVQVSVGSAHACGLAGDGTIACWGGNDYGESTPPTDRFIRVACGMQRTCGLIPGGEVVCWGRADMGILESPAGTFTDVGVGDQFACALGTDTTVSCWGTEPPGLATPVDAGYAAVSVAGQAGCALHTDGDVEGWGYAAPADGPFLAVEGVQYSCLALTAEGEIADPDGGSAGLFPAGAFVALSATSAAGCALAADGRLSCWGSTPPDVTFSSVSIGGSDACGITTDGALACW